MVEMFYLLTQVFKDKWEYLLFLKMSSAACALLHVHGIFGVASCHHSKVVVAVVFIYGVLHPTHSIESYHSPFKTLQAFYIPCKW